MYLVDDGSLDPTQEAGRISACRCKLRIVVESDVTPIPLYEAAHQRGLTALPWTIDHDNRRIPERRFDPLRGESLEQFAPSAGHVGGGFRLFGIDESSNQDFKCVQSGL